MLIPTKRMNVKLFHWVQNLWIKPFSIESLPDLWLFLPSGLGRWGPGWRHEQQRAVSRIPVAHLLNFTKKCNLKKKKKETSQVPVSDLGLDPVMCPTDASDGSSRLKKTPHLAAVEAEALTVHIVYLTPLWGDCERIVLRRSLLYTSAGRRLSGLERRKCLYSSELLNKGYTFLKLHRANGLWRKAASRLPVFWWGFLGLWVWTQTSWCLNTQVKCYALVVQWLSFFTLTPMQVVHYSVGKRQNKCLLNIYCFKKGMGKKHIVVLLWLLSVFYLFLNGSCVRLL